MVPSFFFATTAAVCLVISFFLCHHLFYHANDRSISEYNEGSSSNSPVFRQVLQGNCVHPGVLGLVPNVDAAAAALSAMTPIPDTATTVNEIWINEFHYDNNGADQGEFIEIAFTGGSSDISSYYVILYNGNGGVEYDRSVVPDAINCHSNSGICFSIIDYPQNGLQNGSPDGICLFGPGGVVEFISYESGNLIAQNGPCMGFLGTNTDVEETSSTPIGFSLQRSGNGCSGDDFRWNNPTLATKGELNNYQVDLCESLALPPLAAAAATTTTTTTTTTTPEASESQVQHPLPTTATTAFPTISSSIQVKVMTYNIEFGGRNVKWKDVVKEENPDIVIFTEVGNWDDNNNALLNEFVQEFSTHFNDENPYYGSVTQGTRVPNTGSAIMSRYPIVSTTQLNQVQLDDGSMFSPAHDLMVWCLDIDSTLYYFVGVYLKCCGGITNNNKRDRTMEGLINYLDTMGSVPLVLMGDFNSVSPSDAMPDNRDYNGDFRPSLNSNLGFGPLTMLLYPEDAIYGQYASNNVHTFFDAFRTLNPTCTNNNNNNNNSSISSSSLYCGHDVSCSGSTNCCAERGYTYVDGTYDSRIDYIIVNELVGIIGPSTVGDTTSACEGSDHQSLDVILCL